jgi:hypothetical protein
MRDMFEFYEELPQEVTDVLAKFEAEENTYEACGNLVDALREIGWTCEYYLDAQPYNLRPLTEFDKWELEKVEKVFEAMLDEMSNHEAEEVRKEVRTYEEKIVYFIDQEEKFKKSFE